MQTVKQWKLLVVLEYNICNPLRDLVQFLKFKKRGKHPRRSLTFSKLIKVALLHGCFSRFLNCASGTKLRKTSHIKL